MTARHALLGMIVAALMMAFGTATSLAGVACATDTAMPMPMSDHADLDDCTATCPVHCTAMATGSSQMVPKGKLPLTRIPDLQQSLSASSIGPEPPPPRFSAIA